MPESIQHLSTRVPWHDRGWEGTVCHAPSRNDACLVLPRINEERIDPEEDSAHDRDWNDLPPGVKLPPCVREKAGFMRPTEFIVPITHPYSSWSPAHEGLRPLPLRFPAWSAPCVPFRWMNRKSAEEIAAAGLVDYEPELEAEANVLIGHDTAWVQDGRNQRNLLDTFFDHTVGGLCFFYARRVPHSDEDRKILIGVGRILAVSEPAVFGGTNPLDTVAWECMVQHSIRAELGEGFLLPDHAALERAEQDPGFDPATVLAYVPDEGWDDFAYGTEHVTHDTAISALVACERALREAEHALPGPRTHERQWVSERLGELWRLRGPSPGIGAVLQAFGVLHGTLVMRRLEPYIPENGDPWDVVEAALRDPASLPVDVSDAFTPSLCQKWAAISEDRRALLKLLSRFDLTPDQAERWYEPDDTAVILANPYVLYEADREEVDPIAVTVVDHGAFPDPVIAEHHPLPEPSRVTDNQDVRRGRALLIEQLERTSGQGHTLQSAAAAARAVRDMELTPPCPLDADMVATYDERLEPLIRRVALHDGAPGLQLDRFQKGGNVIRDFVIRRRGGKRHPSVTEWRELLDRALKGAADPDDIDEQRARQEKTAALAELHESRFSVLVGPAGTGKTTLLRTLCDHPSVDTGNVLLLAPPARRACGCRRRWSARAKRSRSSCSRSAATTPTPESTDARMTPRRAGTRR
jgi:AAA domain